MTLGRHLRRYWRAFIGALRLMLSGEMINPPPLERFPQLVIWWRETLRLSDAVISAADANGLPAAARAAWQLHIEGRDLSLETILAAVRFHAATEFPHMMRESEEFNYLALQATNLNDRFLLLKLIKSESQTAPLPEPIRSTIEALAAHLMTLPPKHPN